MNGRDFNFRNIKCFTWTTQHSEKKQGRVIYQKYP